MARRLALVGVTLLATAVLLLPTGQAVADSASFTDPTGDTTLESWESGQTFTDQSDPTVDITQVHVDHGISQLVVTVSVVDVQRVLPHRLTVEIVTPAASGDDRFVASYRRGSATSLGGMAVLQGQRSVDCSGYTAESSLSENTLQVRLPTRCFDNPDWVRVAATVLWSESACHPFCITRSYDRAPDAPGSYFERVHRTTPSLAPLPEPLPFPPACDGAPSSGFEDVQRTNVHVHAIDCVAYLQLAAGRVDGTYGPADELTRGQIASFLVNTLEASGEVIPEPGEVRNAFSDHQDSAHRHSLDVLADFGVLDPLAPGRRIEPGAPVRRDEMAALTHQALVFAGVEDSNRYVHHYDDAAGTLYQRQINLLTELGVVSGRGSGSYAPADHLTRAQMATFLARTSEVLRTL